jgi:uncharacterized coiled-coil DUF342 family protein
MTDNPQSLHNGLAHLAEKLERLTEELRAAHLELIKITTKTSGDVKEHDRIIDRVVRDIDELQRELRATRRDLDAWEQRGSKWGDQLDKSVADLQSRIMSDEDTGTSNRVAYTVAGFSILVTIIVSLLHFLSNP